MTREFRMIQDDTDYELLETGSGLVRGQVLLHTNGEIHVIVPVFRDTESALDFNRTMAQAIRFMQSQLKVAP